MMSFADLERAHLTLAFLHHIPEAASVRISYHRATEQISARVTMRSTEIRIYMSQTTSDDESYFFRNRAHTEENIIISPLPLSLLETE